jgi:hypothetical protein
MGTDRRGSLTVAARDGSCAGVELLARLCEYELCG